MKQLKLSSIAYIKEHYMFVSNNRRFYLNLLCITNRFLFEK
jgi:hypothetical protein